MSYRFEGSLRAGPGWNCSYIPVLLESYLQTCMTYNSAECTVNDPDDGQRKCPKHVEFHAGVDLGN